MIKKYKLICEVCGETQIYDSLDKAYEDGWDYPPHIGTFGILSARTCPDCPIDQTTWWKLQMSGSDHFNAHDLEVIDRIKKEPESLIIEE